MIETPSTSAFSYEKQLASFLKERRGEQTYRQFAHKLGIGASSLQRLEQGEQNVTLRALRLITRRLKVRLKEIFID